MWSDKEVKQLREDLNVTQEELAHRLGVSLVTVAAWEQKRKKPSRLARRELDRLVERVSQ